MAKPGANRLIRPSLKYFGKTPGPLTTDHEFLGRLTAVEPAVLVDHVHDHEIKAAGQA